MRRFSSNSITVFVIEYDTPSFIDMPKVAPSDNRCGASFESRTVPDPSMSR